MQQFGWEIQLNKIYLINELFYLAIKENQLSSDILLSFLRKHSWFGKKITKNLPGGKKIDHNWLNLLAPAINEYFIQMHEYFLNPLYHPNFVLCIDSLTVKMEGLFRDICQLHGVTTFYMTQDTKHRNIVREKDIHALLYEDVIKKLFDEDDLLFFRALLVEKASYNLRHKIAHSLMLYQEYDISLMHLLILSLLRLGRYDFVNNSDSNAEIAS